MEDKKHTPLPWESSGDSIFGEGESGHWLFDAVDSTTDGHRIAPEEREANAEFIVRACNSHYELLDNLKTLRRKTGDLKNPKDPIQQLFLLKDFKDLFDRVDAAIAKAEGK